jgi:hypothetical protein
MLLMAMHDIRVLRRAKDRQAERIRPLPADKPGPADCANTKRTHVLVSIVRTKTDQRRIDVLCHVPGELERVTLRTTNDATRPKDRRNDMNDAHCYFDTSSWKYRNQAGNIQAQRCS